MNIALRPATVDDGRFITDVLTTWMDSTDWLPDVYTAEEKAGLGAFLLSKAQVFLAHAGRAPLGFYAMQNAMIQAFYVSDQARNQGVGATMLAHAKRHNPLLNIWTFAANTGADRFYRRHGFVLTKRGTGQDTDEKLPTLTYEWRGA